MLKATDDFLNKITMYRLVLYLLIILIFIAAVFGFFGILSYNPFSILLSTGIVLISALITNRIFSRVFTAPTNVESVYITALILALIISPASSFSDYMFLVWAGVLSMASKYIFALGRKHLFNPAAVAVVLTAVFSNQSASWWIGNLPMLPFVLIGGLLIARKIRREDMLTTFFISSFLTIIIASLIQGSDVLSVMGKVALHSPIFFFAFVMFTEPLTAPPTKGLQTIFAVLVGFLYAPEVHFGSIYLTPEMALLIGNVFSYFVSPKEKLLLSLKEKIQTSPNTFDFLFPLTKKMAYTPGQYMEWTLPHQHIDTRGNRRYFTLASSPTEDNLRLGVKFYDPPSSFKKSLFNSDNINIVASGRAGDFTLPKNPREKLVFIAGGIGITPFRSMIKYLIDTHQKRDIVLFYSNKKPQDAIYHGVFSEAEKEFQLKVLYIVTDLMGPINAPLITKEVPDYRERIFYLSGPHSLITAFTEILQQMGVSKSKIRTDFFPGFA